MFLSFLNSLSCLIDGWRPCTFWNLTTDFAMDFNLINNSVVWTFSNLKYIFLLFGTDQLFESFSEVSWICFDIGSVKKLLKMKERKHTNKGLLITQLEKFFSMRRLQLPVYMYCPILSYDIEFTLNKRIINLINPRRFYHLRRHLLIFIQRRGFVISFQLNECSYMT
jgi:hypothetical protein